MKKEATSTKSQSDLLSEAIEKLQEDKRLFFDACDLLQDQTNIISRATRRISRPSTIKVILTSAITASLTTILLILAISYFHL